ncbi:MAG: DEAD/DEAH box helicase, partial [Bacilli bacterium]|nr:DEAD/DEAH box helicase [Bacilli bacterium]
MRKAIDFLLEKSEFSQLVKTFGQREQNIVVKDSTEEVGLLLACADYIDNQESIFAVAPNLFHAQMMYDKLSNSLGEENVLFFPQDEFITSEMLVSSWEFRIERINTIKDILSGKSKIIVTHLQGVLKPQLTLKRWKNAIIRAFTNQDISIGTLVEQLINLGYSREYTVEKMGDFSVRGGIVDVYPLGEEAPVRFDFFGDVIETIKLFDVETQRSVTTVSEVFILPMTEFFYSEADYMALKHSINEKLMTNTFVEPAANRIMEDLQNLESHRDLDRLTRYIPYMTDRTYTIIDFIPQAKVMLFNYKRIVDQYELMNSELTDWLMHTDDYAKMDFTFYSDINLLAKTPAVYLEYFLDQPEVHDPIVFSLSANEPLTFNGNIHLLLHEIKERQQKTTILLAVSTTKTREELLILLEENEIKYRLLGDKDKILKNQVNIIISDQYFDYFSEAHQFMVVTEAAIKKQETKKKRGHYISVYDNSKRLASINDLKHGDYVVHYDYGIGKFLDIKTMELGNTLNDYIHIEYRDGDKLYIPIESFTQIHKYAGSEGFVPRLSKLGGTDWQKTKQRVKAKTKDIAEKLIKLYSQREKATGFSYLPNPALESDLEVDFPYEETKDQLKAINEVFSDMELDKPMDRLICGDVGFGKTEVALRAAFRAVLNNKQVAYLAPTTVLSKQHYQTFSDRMEKFGVNVVLLNRFVSKKHQRVILNGLKAGTIDILIGTHRILSNDIVFHDLGLLIIDEEQRFGVQHKERIKELKVNIDVLSLSATPIPRTLQMAIMGVKNMSLLESAPENRYPIQTYVLERNDTIVKDAIERELARKGQVFYLYNRIDDIEDIAIKIKQLVPHAQVEFAHGQMHKSELEDVIDDF